MFFFFFKQKTAYEMRISDWSSDVCSSDLIEIMNPNHVICTLDRDATLSMELTVETGKGYVPASANRPEDAPIGLIPVDAVFSPEIGSASCRERVCQSVSISVVAVSLKKKTH